jgi:hypothetical protein
MWNSFLSSPLLSFPRPSLSIATLLLSTVEQPRCNSVYRACHWRSVSLNSAYKVMENEVMSYCLFIVLSLKPFKGVTWN